MFILTNIINYIRKPELSSDTLPDVEVKLLDGTVYTLQKGKPLIIHFWATWCPACKLEAANMEHVSRTYEVLTVAVNSGDDKKIKRFLQERSLDFRVLNDKAGKWARIFRVQAFPTTFIYDAEGTLRFTEVGYTTTAGLLARMALIE